jgi:transposase
MPKRTKKTVLGSQAREFVVRLRDYFERELQNGGPLLPFTQVVERVADALDIGRNTVTRITREKYGQDGMSENKVSTPNKKRTKAKPITDIDDFTKDAIRNHIYNYYTRTEIPTLQKLAKSLNEADLYKGGVTSLRKIIRSIGFTYTKINKRKIIMERHDIALARCTFLRQAKEITNWEKVVFLDETWLNANHTVGKCWTDNTAKSSTKVPEGKGERLIICHAGTASGFVPNCLLAFKSKKTNEYHEEMNFEKFRDWFIGLLDNLQEPTVIIMDNAPYHSVQLNKPPAKSKNKSEMVKWLNENGVSADMKMLKTELFGLVQRHKPPKPTYALDEMAKERGHQVLRLPPYHCQYNAIELVWAQIKGKVYCTNYFSNINNIVQGYE